MEPPVRGAGVVICREALVAAAHIWTKTRTACHNSSSTAGACIYYTLLGAKKLHPARVMGSKTMFKELLACYAVLGNSLQLLNAGGGRGAGLLLPRALNERQQSQMYAYVCANARGTQEWQNLQVDAGTLACDERDMFKTPIPAERPLPLLVHKHPYTLKSNGEEPRTILTWARQLASYAARKVASVDATGLAPRDERARLARALRATRLDSLVSILYRARGALRPHVDHGLEGLGLAVSLCVEINAVTETTSR